MKDTDIQLQNLINKIAEDKNLHDYNIVIKSSSSEGNGFLSELKTIDIIEVNKQNHDEINLFVKSQLTNDSIKEVPFNEICRRECFAYCELKNVFDDLYERFSVPPENRLNMIKAYGTINNKTLIMENMKKKSYVSLHRFDPMTIELAEMTLQQMASLHAVSFAIEKYSPKFFSEVIKEMNYPLKHELDWEKRMKESVKIDLKFLKTDEMRVRVKHFKENMLEKYRNYHNDTAVVSGLSHGDIRLGNIIVKRKDSKLYDLVIHDYQLLHYGPIINDFMFFIFTSTDQEFRNKYLQRIMNHYHACFSSSLEKFDINVQDIYPKKCFEQDFKERIDFSLMTMFNFLPVVLAPDDDIPDLNLLENGELVFESRSEEYIRRLNELAEELIEVKAI